MYGREEATLRKSVCFDELRCRVSGYATVRVWVLSGKVNDYRFEMRTRGKGGKP